MVRQRMLTIPQSVRVGKFWFSPCSEKDEYDDYASNRDNVNVARRKTEDKKEKKSSKEGKKDKGENDECVNPSAETEEKNEKVCKLKSY